MGLFKKRIISVEWTIITKVEVPQENGGEMKCQDCIPNCIANLDLVISGEPHTSESDSAPASICIYRTPYIGMARPPHCMCTVQNDTFKTLP